MTGSQEKALARRAFVQLPDAGFRAADQCSACGALPRADGMAWKPICWQFGLSRTAATKRWQYGLAVITWRLNGRVPSARRSQQFVIENANRLSRTIVL